MQVLGQALKKAAQEDMPQARWRVFRTKVLGDLVDVFHRGLSEDPPASVPPMRPKWKPHAQVPMAKPRPYPLDKCIAP